MYTEILRSVNGIGVFPAVSLVLFVAVFTIMLLRVARMDPTRASGFAHLPLDAQDRRAHSDGAQR
jgi:cytochrome c oxidase cbb3-type subunit IV